MIPYRILTTSVFLLAACQGNDAPPAPINTGGQPAGAVPLTRFSTDSTAYAQYSGVTTAQQIVVRAPAEWRALWQTIHATMAPMPDLPAVDFSQDMILVAALGSRSTGGYDVLLAQATEDGEGLLVEVVEKRPGADCVTTQALTQPVDLARIARQDGTVRFVETKQTVSCGS